MSDACALGDQRLLSNAFDMVPYKHLNTTMEIALLRGPVTLPSGFKSLNVDVPRIMKEIKEAEQYTLDQYSASPEKVAPMTKEKLAFLAEARKRFEVGDGKNQRFRHTYLPIRQESSKVPLENLEESASHSRISERVYTNPASSFDL